MWIAKPLSSLSSDEQSAWRRVLDKARTQSYEAPLAQSLAWGHAIEAVSGQVHAVFSPEESAGGLLFATPHPQGIQFECINGPLLDWSDETAVKRQLAVFATAVSRLHPRFARLLMRPRWLKTEALRNRAALPIPPTAYSSAATRKISLSNSENSENLFAPRLKRTLKISAQAGVTAQWERLTSSNLVEFALATQAFGRKRGFTVPPIFWFKALTDSGDPSLRFGLVTARTPKNETGCQLLIALHGEEAHYLFGHEWRDEGSRAAVSPSAAAHRFAIDQSLQEGASIYDFNGALEDPVPGNPYSGVSEFKAQFGGKLVIYEVPELLVEL
jgi:hypothetical protein